MIQNRNESSKERLYKWDTAIISYIYINLFVLRYKTNRTYVFGDCKRLKKANRVRLDSMHEIIPRIGQTTFWEIIVSSSFSFLSYTFIYIYFFFLKFIFTYFFSYPLIFFEGVREMSCRSSPQVSHFSFFFFYSFLIFYFFFNYYYYYSRVCTYVRVYVDANETRVNKWCNRKIDECAFCRSYFPILSVLATFWSPIDRCPL